MCVCDVPFPSDDQTLGYTGEECEIPIYAAKATGVDLTQACSSSGCEKLTGDQWACFAIPTDPAANYLALLLQRTSDAGDPDLYGYLWDPAAPAKRPRFGDSPSGFDFQETGAKAVSRVTIGDLANQTGGVVVCAHAYGTTALTFSLKATLDPCPNTFSYADGTPLMCHSPKDASEEDRRYTECTAQGECVCKPPFARPVAEVFPGLGFEDCSAVVTPVNDSNPFTVEGAS